MRLTLSRTGTPRSRLAADRTAAEPPDPDLVLLDARTFAALARSGSYIAGDRRVSPRERSQWRVTFRGLAADALAALRAESPEPAEEAVALLIDLACETRGHDYFRSEDPMEAAQFVVSDAAALLWESLRERRGFSRFAEVAAAQLPRWESAYGWSRRGWGKLAGKETSLAAVLSRMLQAPDAWTAFADAYLTALNGMARTGASKPPSRDFYSFSSSGSDHARTERARHLAEWHAMLLGRLAGSEAEDRLDRLAAHPGLGGPERTFFQARLAQLHGDIESARTLARTCLERLPGHDGFADFAIMVGAELPASTQEKLAERARLEAAEIL